MKIHDEVLGEIEISVEEYLQLKKERSTQQQAITKPKINPSTEYTRKWTRVPAKTKQWKRRLALAIEHIKAQESPINLGVLCENLNFAAGGSATKLGYMLENSKQIQAVRTARALMLAPHGIEISITKPKNAVSENKRLRNRTTPINDVLEAAKELINSNDDEKWTTMEISAKLRKKGMGISGFGMKKLKEELISSSDIQKIGGEQKPKFASLEYSPELNYTKKTRNVSNPELQRRRFSMSRAWALIKQNPSLSFERAMQQANQEWAAKGQIQKVRVDDEPPKKKIVDDIPDEFPQINSVADSLILMKIKDIISECISVEGKIGYFALKDICGWYSGVQWLHFIEDFMSKKEQIAKFFCVPDKFNRKKIGEYDYLVYGTGY